MTPQLLFHTMHSVLTMISIVMRVCWATRIAGKLQFEQSNRGGAYISLGTVLVQHTPLRGYESSANPDVIELSLIIMVLTGLLVVQNHLSSAHQAKP